MPYDDVDFAAILDALAEGGFVKKYKIGENEYGVVPTFKKHQHIGTKEKQIKTAFPPPPDVNGYESGSDQVREPDAALGVGVGVGVGKDSAEAEPESPTSPLEKKNNKYAADVLADKLWPLMQQRVLAVGTDTGAAACRIEVDGKTLTEAQFRDYRLLRVFSSMMAYLCVVLPLPQSIE